MSGLSRRNALALLGSVILMPGRGWASQTKYQLNRTESNVGFQYSVNGSPQAGTMPVQQAEIVIDRNKLQRSSVAVTLDVTGARTPFLLATRALTGPEVLDAAQFPTIHFVSRSIQLSSEGKLSGGASVQGDLTLRGVTQAITLMADVFRAHGSSPDDLSNLTVRLRGSVNRSDFGASGYPDLVGDLVVLDLTAVINTES